MGHMIIKEDGTKHYVPYDIPKTQKALEVFVINKAKERLKNIPVCTNKIYGKYPITSMQEVWDLIDNVVFDSLYHNQGI